MKKLIEKVKEILEEKPATRDCDIELAKVIWTNQGALDFNYSTAYQLLVKLQHNQLSSLESIGRARRRVEEKYPHLRGTSWLVRHNLAKEFKKEIIKL